MLFFNRTKTVERLRVLSKVLKENVRYSFIYLSVQELKKNFQTKKIPRLMMTIIWGTNK